MKSFSILRGHTGLSTNAKIVIDSNYGLFLDTINSSPELSSTRFKKFRFNKTNYLDELIPYFFKELPTEIAFSVKYDNDNSNMTVEFENQYDDMYLAGAKNIIQNKDYTEEYEYFAPLYVFKHHIPKYFIIFRIDGPGLDILNKDNFKSEWLQKLKSVKLFDLTDKTDLGFWLKRNFTDNQSFPIAPLDVDFRELEFTRWWGIDYYTGGYTYKSFYLDENLQNENTLFDFEKLFVDGYAVNGVVFPHILNLTFLFDDEPATPTDLRKWSINRYAGFYLEDMEVIEKITPFIMPQLKSDVEIKEGNILTTPDESDPFVNGFRDDSDMWIEYLGDFYKVIKIEELGKKSVVPINKTKLKEVIIDEVGNPTIIKYKIVTDLDLSGKESLLNTRSYYINSNKQIVSVVDDSPLQIIDFDFADVNLIQIEDRFHNLQLVDGYLTLVTDFGFNFKSESNFNYFINSGRPGFNFTINLTISNSNPPKNFKFFRLKFTDIKDFDTNIIDTDLSKFEYEKFDDLTKTEEPKMYFTDLRGDSNPKNFDDFKFKDKVELIPTSSDYIANLEAFRISNNKLTDLWRKNPIHVRWGYQNSLSAFDYPYYLNNSDLYGEYNLTCDTKDFIPYRKIRNLDYFYTINSGSASYLFHSLHIDKNFESFQDKSFIFELDKYLELGTYSFNGLEYNYDFDYFDIFFSPKHSYLDGDLMQNVKKYSYFESGDKVDPNTTVFRGMKFKLYEVDNIKFNSYFIENINLFSSNKFIDYKFSILLSSNDWMINSNGELYKPYNWDYYVDAVDESGKFGILTSYSTLPGLTAGDIVEISPNYPYTSQIHVTSSNIDFVGDLPGGGKGFILDKDFSGDSDNLESGIWRNKMQWQPINNWEIDTHYKKDDLVIFESVIYRVLNDNIVEDPSIDPTISGDYSVETNFTQFWNYNATYSTSDWVYHDEEYYYYNDSGSIDFWSNITTYSNGDKVIYGGRYFEAIEDVPIGFRPLLENRKTQSSSGTKYWKEITKPDDLNLLWLKVELWVSISYTDVNNDVKYVIFGDTLWKRDSDVNSDDIPGISDKWVRIYSFVPDTDFIYGPTQNSIIKLGDVYYYCKYNPSLTLDSGITIYINKKWKNVLVNISINDNTILSNKLVQDSTKNIERDELYIQTNGRLTAANFIRQINDLDTLYGFVDFTSYVIIEEDGSFKKYNFKNGLSELPYFLVVEESDAVDVKLDSLRYSINTVDKNILKPVRALKDGLIDSLDKIDFYNEVPLGVEIENVKEDPNILKNYNKYTDGLSKGVFETLYRFSGFYMPIFYDIQLFSNTSLYQREILCDVQLVISIDSPTDVELVIEFGEVTQIFNLNLNPPVEDSLGGWVEFYNQIVDVITESEVLSGIELFTDIYEPGNTSIHPNIEEGFYVLSVKYKSDVCSLRLLASESTISCDITTGVTLYLDLIEFDTSFSLKSSLIYVDDNNLISSMSIGDGSTLYIEIILSDDVWGIYIDSVLSATSSELISDNWNIISDYVTSIRSECGSEIYCISITGSINSQQTINHSFGVSGVDITYTPFGDVYNIGGDWLLFDSDGDITIATTQSETFPVGLWLEADIPGTFVNTTEGACIIPDLLKFCAKFVLGPSASETIDVGEINIEFSEFSENGEVNGKKSFIGLWGNIEYVIEWSGSIWILYFNIDGDLIEIAELNENIDIPLSTDWVISLEEDFIVSVETYQNGCTGVCVNIEYIANGKSEVFNIQFGISDLVENGFPVYFALVLIDDTDPVPSYLKYDGEKWMLTYLGGGGEVDIAYNDTLEGDWIILDGLPTIDYNELYISSSFGLCDIPK